MAKKPAQKPDAGDEDDPIPEEINDMIRRALKKPPAPRKSDKHEKTKRKASK